MDQISSFRILLHEDAHPIPGEIERLVEDRDLFPPLALSRTSGEFEEHLDDHLVGLFISGTSSRAIGYAVPRFTPAGKFLGFIISWIDIYNRKEQETQMEASLHGKDDLLNQEPRAATRPNACQRVAWRNGCYLSRRGNAFRQCFQRTTIQREYVTL